jgi:hypothetical protein
MAEQQLNLCILVIFDVVSQLQAFPYFYIPYAEDLPRDPAEGDWECSIAVYPSLSTPLLISDSCCFKAPDGC